MLDNKMEWSQHLNHLSSVLPVVCQIFKSEHGFEFWDQLSDRFEDLWTDLDNHVRELDSDVCALVNLFVWLLEDIVGEH